MRVITLFSLCYDENLFGASFWYSLNCFSYFVVVKMGAAVDGVHEVRVTRSYPMSFD